MAITLLGPTGAPLVGAENHYVTDALVTLGFAPVYTDGDEIEEKNACGVVVVNYKARDTFKRGDVSITMATPDPFASALLSGGSVMDVVGLPKGFRAPPIGPVTGDGIGIELWAVRVDDGTEDANYPYARWLYPMVKNLRLGDHEHGAGALKPPFTGQAYQNDNWGNGPKNDWDGTSDRVYQWLPTATIPTPTCALEAVIADV